MESVTYNIPAISCSSCSKNIQESIQTIHGVENISTDLKTQMVQIEFDSGIIPAEEIKKQIIALGYEVD